MYSPNPFDGREYAVLSDQDWDALVAVGDEGAIFTSPKDPVSISPRISLRSGLSLHLTPSHLFITQPDPLNGQTTRAAIYTLSGDKVVEFWARANREIKIPIDNLVRGRYVCELKRGRFFPLASKGP